MSRIPAGILPVMFFVAFCCCASPAGAEPIVVTSGIVEAGFGSLGEPWNAEALQLMGAGFSISSSLEDENALFQLATPPTLAPGALVDFSGELRVGDVIGALLNDSFGLLAAPFTMSFAASPTPLACSSAGPLTECTAIAPFRFDAVLSFTPLSGVPVTHHIIGGGMVQGTLFRSGSFEAGGVRYIFEPSPVPEPATLSLFATGAIVAGARIRRRRRAAHRT